jgi:hypothetical protein
MPLVVTLEAQGGNLGNISVVEVECVQAITVRKDSQRLIMNERVVLQIQPFEFQRKERRSSQVDHSHSRQSLDL